MIRKIPFDCILDIYSIVTNIHWQYQYYLCLTQFNYYFYKWGSAGHEFIALSLFLFYFVHEMVIFQLNPIVEQHYRSYMLSNTLYSSSKRTSTKFEEIWTVFQNFQPFNHNIHWQCQSKSTHPIATTCFMILCYPLDMIQEWRLRMIDVDFVDKCDITYGCSEWKETDGDCNVM